MSRLLVLVLLLGFPMLAPANTVLVLGDSLSAAYGLPQQAGWVSLLAKRVEKTAPDYKVVNASISGETAAGGRRRIDALLSQHRPSIVVIELGANDGLRGQRIEALQADLDAIVAASVKRTAQVVLVGMRMPPNYGADYVRRFEGVYPAIAAKYRVSLVPFLLEGFAERHEMFQPDGVHPTGDAQAAMLETVWKVLGPLMQKHRPPVSRR